MILRPRKQKGFTLVELMVATAITGVLIVIIMAFLTNSLVSISRESARSDLLLDAQNTLDVLTGDIRASSNAYESASLPDGHAPDSGWQSDDTTLILGLAALDSDRNILFADTLHYTSHKNNAIYFVSDNKLYKRTLAAEVTDNAARTNCPEWAANENCPADAILAHNVKQFTVHYYDGNSAETTPDNARSVAATLELETRSYGQTINATYTARSVFRNQ